jgi:surfactin synthase thioesterase subunit
VSEREGFGDEPSLSLVCLPFAGSGASFYRAWSTLPTSGLTVVPVQLPGREELFIQTAFTDAIEAAAFLAPIVAELAEPAPRFVLFGHSLGAVLALEIARALGRIGGRQPARLYVSGSAGPQHIREKRATGLGDDEFLARVEEFAEFRHKAFDNPALRELLLPTLRADVEMHENYRPSSSDPIAVPITSIRGSKDALVSRHAACEWSEVTRCDFKYIEVPGGHMYLVDAPALVMRSIARG